MKIILKEDYPAWRDSFLELPANGLRVNENKISRSDFAALWKKFAHEELEEIPWVSSGFFTDGSARYSKDPFFHAGLYYLQEPSAMTPAENLPVVPGDYVLDLCASPGGKATQILSRLSGRGLLLANDISASRAAVLKKNIEMSGARNAFVTAEKPEKLAASFPEFFDAILVDAPCSGEGMFRREPSMASYWEMHGPSEYAPKQKELLTEALQMLRPGGYLMYSTCTFSFEENEKNVLELLRKNPDLHLCAVKSFPGYSYGLPEIPVCEGASIEDGVKNRERACADTTGIEKCVRLYSHKMRAEGQFMALMKKEGNHSIRKEKEPLLLERDNEIYLLPEGLRPEPSLRYLMTGLHIGTRKKDRILLAQPFAMAGAPGCPLTILNLPHDDLRTIKYLKGETIEADDTLTAGPKEGQECMTLFRKTRTKEILVMTEGFPLGFAERNGTFLKNKRNPGWRML